MSGTRNPGPIKRWKSQRWRVSYCGTRAWQLPSGPCAECSGRKFWWDAEGLYCASCFPRPEGIYAEATVSPPAGLRESFEGKITIIYSGVTLGGGGRIVQKEVRSCHWEIGPYAQHSALLQYSWLSRGQRHSVRASDDVSHYLVGLAGWELGLEEVRFAYSDRSARERAFRGFDDVLEGFVAQTGAEVLFDFRFTKADLPEPPPEAETIAKMPPRSTPARLLFADLIAPPEKSFGERAAELSEKIKATGAFARFCDQAHNLFAALARDYRGSRKPPINLRLLRRGATHRLCVSPTWNRRVLRIEEELFFELMRQEERFDGGGYEFRKELCFLVSGEKIRPQMLPCLHWSESLEALVEVIEDFVGDPGSVLARDSDNCCICGRALTDGTSRSRGVGPECVKSLPFLRFKGPVVSECELLTLPLEAGGEGA